MQGYQPLNVVIGGDSAGGGLTMATLLRCQLVFSSKLEFARLIRVRRARELGMPLPAAAVCLSPWV